MMSLERYTGLPALAGGISIGAYYRADTEFRGEDVKVFRRIFLTSLFLVFTVLLAVWFYPGVRHSFFTFYYEVQGHVGTEEYEETAVAALDVTFSLLCTSGIFYGIALAKSRGRSTAAPRMEPRQAIKPIPAAEPKTQESPLQRAAADAWEEIMRNSKRPPQA